MPLIANFSAVENDTELTRKLRKLLYFNPLDSSGSSRSLESHSHSVSLKSCVKNTNEVHPETIDGVFHMLSNSTLKFINAQIFILNGSNRLLELVHSNPEQPIDVYKARFRSKKIIRTGMEKVRPLGVLSE